MKNDVLIYHEVEKEGCPKRDGGLCCKGDISSARFRSCTNHNKNDVL